MVQFLSTFPAEPTRYHTGPVWLVSHFAPVVSGNGCSLFGIPMNHCHHFVVQMGNEVLYGFESGEYRPGFSSSANPSCAADKTGDHSILDQSSLMSATAHFSVAVCKTSQ